MVRDTWCSLNGVWEVDRLAANATSNFQNPEYALVPFPLESALSGVRNTTASGWAIYRREFELPPALVGEGALLLHFEAVDWRTEVTVNGKPAGQPHEGGYDAFHYDISSLVGSGASRNTLVVSVYDPETNYVQPVGKQNCGDLSSAFGVMYTCSTGIWGSVWLERTATDRRIVTDTLRMTPVVNTDTQTWELDIALNVAGSADSVTADMTVHFTALHPTNRQKVTTVIPVMADGTAAGTLTLGLNPGASTESSESPLAEAALWSPDSPALYNATVELVSTGESTPLDTFATYFGLRTIKIQLDDAGIPRPMLNGKFIFQVGTLDQGFVSLSRAVRCRRIDLFRDSLGSVLPQLGVVAVSGFSGQMGCTRPRQWKLWRSMLACTNALE
jgi:beta-galactosidase/beta-glucuronidase